MYKSYCDYDLCELYCLNDDQNAFNTIVERHEPIIHYNAHKMERILGSERMFGSMVSYKQSFCERDDYVQQILIILYNSIKYAFRNKNKFKDTYHFSFIFQSRIDSEFSRKRTRFFKNAKFNVTQNEYTFDPYYYSTQKTVLSKLQRKMLALRPGERDFTVNMFDHNYINDELLKKFKNVHLSEKQVKIFNFLELGYKKKEIVKELKTSYPNVKRQIVYMRGAFISFMKKEGYLNNYKI